MPTTFLKPIIFVSEGKTEVPIICSLLDTHDRTIYMISAGGYANVASTVRTQYLMNGDSYNYIAIFDSDSEDEEICQERLETVKYLSGAYMHTDNIGVFCFKPNFEEALGISKNKGSQKDDLYQFLHEHQTELKDSANIKDLQSFINKLS